MIEVDRDWLDAHPLPQPDGDTDKNARGRVLAAGGSAMVPGALRLTGEAALRAGAGKIQLATIEAARAALGVAIPEAAVFALPTNDDGELDAAAGKRIAALLGRCDALVFGPGMGADSHAEAMLTAVLDAEARPALLLDAAVIGAAATLADALRDRDGPVVLTPHPGEMARLMDCDEAEVSRDPQGLARQAAELFDATIALKSAETWIACPGREVLHYPGGGHGLATAGSGDVLAGIIGGLLSRGASPQRATAWGVWLHGEAGRRLSERVGPLGFLARELAAEVPGLMAR